MWNILRNESGPKTTWIVMTIVILESSHNNPPKDNIKLIVDAKHHHEP